jgi:hypothetical protein
MVGENLTENFFKDKFPVEDAVDASIENVLDIHGFDSLIDAYQEAQRSGGSMARVKARNDLKNAYRAALRAAGRSDR